MKQTFFTLAAVGWLLTPAVGFETTYWVWHRDSPLTPEEGQTLRTQEVRTLYWHVGTLRAEGPSWRLAGGLLIQPPSETSLAIVPVLRLSSDGAPPWGEAALVSLSGVLSEALRRTGAAEIQIDFDCPDRRLGDYAHFLSQCRDRLQPAKLSITAHAGWSRLAAFEDLQASVDALVPMFYDLTPDAPSEVCAGRVLPLVDAAGIGRQLASWRTCRIPWLAGLPNFARVTVFGRDGHSRGHLRAWEWDEICFNPDLVLAGPSAAGVTTFRAGRDTVVADTPVQEGEIVACRWPDPVQLATTLASVRKSGASGVAFFRLPGTGSQGGWSLRQVGALLRDGRAGEPVCQLRRVRNMLELVNVSDSDLPPRLAGPAGPGDRGWQLEIESTGGAVFREATPGEFASVFAHADPDAPEPRRVPVPMAERLTYWFADLRAGQSRQTGLLQLARNVDFSVLRWRWCDGKQTSPWQSIQ